MKALGLIELLGYCPTVVALDTALKTSDVSFEQVHKIDKGIVSLSITGDVAAVQAAVDAAAAAASQVGEVLDTHVIARPHDEVDCTLVVPKKKVKAEAPQTPAEPSEKDGEAEKEEPKAESDEENPAGETEEADDEQNAELKTQAETLLKRRVGTKRTFAFLSLQLGKGVLKREFIIRTIGNDMRSPAPRCETQRPKENTI